MTNDTDIIYPQFLRLDTKAKEKLLELIDENTGTCFSGKEQGEVYLLAASMGLYAGTKKKTSKATDIRTYHKLSQEYKVLIRSIALADSGYDYQVLFDGARVLKIVEEYANEGVQLLYDKIYSKGFDLSIENDILDLLGKIENKKDTE